MCEMGAVLSTYLSNIQIARQETPVDVGPVPDVWVIVICCRQLQDLLN